jgi:Ca2+-binding RTX toxin-like protein
MAKSRLIAAATALFGVGVLAAAGAGHTFASYSDFADVRGNVVGATTWQPRPPSECAKMTFDNILFVPPGVTTYTGTNHNDLIFANNSGDTIDGGNGDDCIVGGNGDDTLTGGNGKDVILGGAGNDVINGDNAPDHVDGGEGNDTCNGGRAPDALISCEHAS